MNHYINLQENIKCVGNSIRAHSNERVEDAICLDVASNSVSSSESVDDSAVIHTAPLDIKQYVFPSETRNAPSPEVVLAVDEEKRLKALHGLGLVGTLPESRFDAITAFMKIIYGTPVSALTLICEETIYMHSRAGHFSCCAPRRGSFCDWILEGPSARMLVVEDADHDERFRKNKFVCGPPYVRFYAGCPLVGSHGVRYGTLCILDFVPRNFDADQYRTLCKFAHLASQELERGRISAISDQHISLCAVLRECISTSSLTDDNHVGVWRALDAVREPVVLADMSQPSWSLAYANPVWMSTTGYPSPSGRGFWEVFDAAALVDPADVDRAVTAVNKGEEFSIKIRSFSSISTLLTSNTDDEVEGTASVAICLTLDFKPILSGRLKGAASTRSTLPSSSLVGIPSGMQLDHVDRDEQKHLKDPAVTRRLFDPGLGDGKRFALAAALAALSAENPATDPHCCASISSAATAAATLADAAEPNLSDHMKQAATEPIYYLGAVACTDQIETPSWPTRPSSMDLNNDVRLSSNELPSSRSSQETSNTDRDRWDSLTSMGGVQNNTYLRNAVAPPKTEDQLIQTKPKPAALHWALLDLHSPSDNWNTKEAIITTTRTSQQPESLRKLVLGALIGHGSIGRCYRGIWQGARVAVKVVDFWEDGQGGTLLIPWGSVLPPEQIDCCCDACTTQEEGSLHAISTLAPGLGLAHPNLLQTYVAAASARDVLREEERSVVDPWHTVPYSDPTSGVFGRGDGRLRLSRQVWLVQKFADRGPLHDAIVRGDLFRDGRPDVQSILHTARDIVSAVSFLHTTGTLHGALHPGNVLLCSDAADAVRGWTAQVSDYGMVRGCPSDMDSTAGDCDVSPSQMHLNRSVAHVSPEVLLGSGKLTQAADVYAFGVLFWEMWSGRRAWRNASAREVMHAVAIEGCALPVPGSVPRDVAHLMTLCLQSDEKSRPTFGYLEQEIDRMLGLQI